MARDITERKHIEQKLASSEIKYRRIFESLDDVYYQTDNEGRIRILSPSLKRIAGWEPAELIGRPVADVYVEPGDRKSLLSILAREKHVRDYDVALKKKDGTPIYASLSCQLLFDHDGQPDGICGILKDITVRKLMEEELKEHRKNLEALVWEQTQELRMKSEAVEELNVALRVLLRQVQEDKETLEQRFVANVNKLVLPYLKKINKSRLDKQQSSYLDIMEANLNEIMSPLLHNLQQINLTPRETQVANLVKEGKTTKEIAQIVGVATDAVNSYRNSIRQKLGLNNKKVNLQSYLESLK